jgi:class 3 adenylate cyclase/tetratricopeptide (TPR) repeat protein
MAVCVACGAENPEGQRFCGSCGAPLQQAALRREQRKTVTAVFCDLVGSTALGEMSDPEAVRIVLARYFERMRAIVEAHGGTVQKFIGDAVVAIFGVPAVHEDDALRALRAAEEMRQALPGLGVDARFGVNTGEVVTSSDDTLVTGDAVNVAARLQQAAAPGEILLGGQTLALVRDAASVETLDPLELKGKAKPVAAFRLLAVGEASGRVHTSRFVGRAKELSLLHDAWERAQTERRCEFVTIVGEPGVGKSRLVAEFAAGCGARVVLGRCLSYGEGITYFPVVDVIRQLAAVPQDSGADAAIRSLLGEMDAATSPDEIAWAFRKLLEQEAPLLVVFDDIQWGEETFLDLVEQVALLVRGAPLVLLCLSRPELEERRSRWPVALRLEPLPEAEVEELLPATLPGELRRRIVHAAGGNPLFVTEMVAMAAGALEEVVVPATLRALLAARVDQLEASERDVLERGAVEGELFHRGPVQALTGAQVSVQLSSLMRRELIRPDSGLLPGEDAFRFCHLLIRDAAYDALPKSTRAELHERFADWLDEHGDDLVERDEIIAYHLQQTYRYRRELGDPEDVTLPLGQRASGHLAAAGSRASVRGDYRAVSNLLERALAFGIPDPHERVRVQVDLGKALYEVGRIAESEAVLAATRDAATGLAERGLAERALIQAAASRLTSDPAVGAAEILPVAEEAIRTFEALGDPLGLAEAERLLAEALSRLGRTDEGLAAYERALAHAEVAEATGLRRRIIVQISVILIGGSMPLDEKIGRLEQLMTSSRDDPLLEAAVGRFLATALAMTGRFDDARAQLDTSSAVLEEAKETNWSLLSRGQAANAYQLMGDAAAAEQQIISSWLHYRDARGEKATGPAMLAAAQLALLCGDQGRWDEAAEYLAYGQEVDHSPPAFGKRYAYLRLAARARVAAHDGRHGEAIELVRTALEVAAAMEPNGDANVWLALAEVQRASGNNVEADVAVQKVLELYEQKGNVTAAGRLRAAYPDLPSERQ